MARTFRSSRAYHPSASLLGRAIRSWVDDRLRGEALYLVALTGLTLAVLMAHYLGWALLKPLFAEHPSWQTWFWGGQVISVLALIGVGLIGFRPAVYATCRRDALELSQGGRSLTLPYTDITDIEILSAVRYHRHYRRYAATRIFLSALPEEVLLLRTPDGPVVVGFSDPDDQRALHRHLQSKRRPSPPPAAKAEA